MRTMVIRVLCVIFLYLEVGLGSSAGINPPSSVTASVSILTDKPLHITDDRYLSLGLDVSIIRRQWVTFNFTSTRMLTLARGLSPAYLRVSGTDADRMVFKKDGKVRSKKDTINTFGLEMKKILYKEHKQIEDTKFTFTGKDWDKLNIFAKSVGWRIIFGLNEQLRNGSSWDPINAMELLDYSIKQGYSGNLDFELGNEPDLYRTSHGDVVINGSQLGNDVIYLRKMLSGAKYGAYFRNSMIVGPDIAFSTQYMTQFLNTGGGVVKAVTWHHYYGSGKLIHLNNFTDPHLLDSYITRAKAVAVGIKRSAYPNLKSWQGETGTTPSSPGTDIEISYVAGFMLMDKLGLNAQLGVELFVRQTFYGLWFGLVDLALHPTPAYWISLLYKKLVGRYVLETNVVVSEKRYNPRVARFYAHCTPPSVGYPKGAVTLYGMNLFDVQLRVKLWQSFEVDQYLLTPGGWGGITSRFIALNGQILMMPDEYTLPPLRPKPLPPGMELVLPRKSLGFYVVKNVRANACMSV